MSYNPLITQYVNNNVIKLGGLDHIINSINAIEFIFLIGCGTSFNASLLGEIYLNEINYFLSVKIINACEFNENILPFNVVDAPLHLNVEKGIIQP